mgnify:CR=1 FL=1
MVGLIGILLSLGLLMFLAYRGINVLVLAPIMALLAALLGTIWLFSPILTPFVKLAEILGSFVGQVTEDPILSVEILFDGQPSQMNTRALTSAALAGLLKPQMQSVNMVSAPLMAKERGIQVSEVRRDKTGVFDGYIKVTIKTAKMERSIAGTCFSDGKPRFIQIKDINMEADVGRHMLYTTNKDVPGVIGEIGMTFGKAGINIANFHLGRDVEGGNAIALLYLDGPLSDAFIAEVASLKAIGQAKLLEFDV